MSFAERIFVREAGTASSQPSGDVVLGDDWIAPESTVESDLKARRDRRSFFSLQASPLTRKIVTFNLIALNVLAAGILYLNSSQESQGLQRTNSLIGEARLVSDVFEAQLPSNGPINLAAGDGVDVSQTLETLSLREGVEVFVFDLSENLIGQTRGDGSFENNSDFGLKNEPRRTIINDALTGLWNAASALFLLPTIKKLLRLWPNNSKRWCHRLFLVRV